jgi:hypothetical protein
MSDMMFANAVTLGEMPYYGDHRPKPAPEKRLCPSCRESYLSRYNRSDVCFACEESHRVVSTRPQPKPQTKRDAWMEKRLDEALAAARTLTPIFSSGQLAQALGIQTNAACSRLRQLAARGDVREVGSAVPTGVPLKGRDSRKAVLMWSAESR